MLSTFVSQDNKHLLVCAMLVTVFMRGPILRARRDYGGSTMFLDQAMKVLPKRGEAEEEE